MTEPPLLRHLPKQADPDALLDGFVNYVTEQGISLYDAQEEAILELLDGNNVILRTPTGSGKSLVAAAAHFAALADGRRSIYTAPIKALVSEKFFALCRDFGSDKVGMVTGDGTVNPDAPIICCTAEILANWALRDGADADVDVVIADEFHFYADPQRGWAWQLPLLELTKCQFLLISATLGPTDFFERELTARTGLATSLVSSDERPVPLDFQYRRTTLHQSIEDLLASGRAPIYLVHFTQREATEAAQGYLSLDPLAKDEKDAVKAAIGNFRFDSPVGKDLRRYLVGGIGVHHAGLLPKYRLLVEKLAQQGLLKIICGTDTLGVGVNVPIRSVLFTQLCKYDGTSTRILRRREFKQIAGRAGRKGFDDEGTVWVQAPAHDVENRRNEEKAAADTKKRKKVVKKKPPDRGYAHWTEDTYNKLVTGDPEPLRSSFHVNHQMVMLLLDRPGDGCGDLRRLLQNNHEPRHRQRQHIKRSIAIYRSLVDAGLLEFPATPDDRGRRVRVNLDLQDEFALHQPLSLWAIEAVGQLEERAPVERTIMVRGTVETHLVEGIYTSEADPLDDPGDNTLDHDTLDVENLDAGTLDGDTDEQLDGQRNDLAPDSPMDDEPASVTEIVMPEETLHALNVLTVIESILENPGVIIAAQVSKAKDELMAHMKSNGVEYEERMERLSQVGPPQPNRDWLYGSFDAFRQQHPWVGGDNVRPKSIVRELYEKAMTFSEFVNHFGLKRSEGVVLRYLSDVYSGLVQNLPEDSKTDEIQDLIEWLGAVVRQVDSSLIDEWERLINAANEPAAGEVRPGVDDEGPFDIMANQRAFRVMVRNEAFRIVQLIARRRTYELGEDFTAAVADYFEDYDEVLLDGDARSPARFVFDGASVVQTVHDPEDNDEWVVRARLDPGKSREEGKAVLADLVLERL
ncbi:MAG: superfamily II RNA helicase [Acidimicrobiales bacterium]|jgi:superfamily II RNA helicase